MQWNLNTCQALGATIHNSAILLGTYRSVESRSVSRVLVVAALLNGVNVGVERVNVVSDAVLGRTGVHSTMFG